ncbi:MAG: LruC domain-containing protein [Rhodoferax sp.]|nr:LruC domain-containing protein [Rhodoferax sp.]MCF8210237.1 LruC domain-containing protein [Rhodoferax sp.]
MKLLRYSTKFIATVVTMAGLAVGWTVLHAALTPASYQLTDVITGGSGTGAGKGAINVFKTKQLTLSGPDLEAFRADSADGKTLSFVVDVNENASGLETSRAMGIAIKSAKLQVVQSGASIDYTHFWTETQALIAERGSTERRLWYTLLGDAGSNEITGRKIGTTVYDSTLKFEVTQPLTAATKATLVIELLTTDANFGEPENFFDYSGGFEDLALITKEKSKVFDVYVPYHPAVGFRTESPGSTLSTEGTSTLTAAAGETYTDTATATTYTIPSDLLSNAILGDLGAAGYQIVAFEDRYPDTGDYDFNDVVVAHRLLNTLDSAGNVVAISGDAYLVARGAGGYNHRWSLDIPINQAGVNAGAFICNVRLQADGAEIANSDTTKSNDSLACVVENVGQVARIVGFRDTRLMLPSMNTNAGEQPGLGSVPHLNFSIALSAPVPVSAVGVASPWIEISRAQSPMSAIPLGTSALQVGLSSRDPQNKPYAMLIPSDWRVPVEGTDIGLAYPNFPSFVTSGGSTNANWYQLADAKKTVNWRVKDVAQ